MIESLGGIVYDDGTTIRLYGERDKIKYDETLRFMLKEELLLKMEPNRVYEGERLGKYFITKGKVETTGITECYRFHNGTTRSLST